MTIALSAKRLALPSLVCLLLVSTACGGSEAATNDNPQPGAAGSGGTAGEGNAGGGNGGGTGGVAGKGGSGGGGSGGGGGTAGKGGGTAGKGGAAGSSGKAGASGSTAGSGGNAGSGGGTGGSAGGTGGTAGAGNAGGGTGGTDAGGSSGNSTGGSGGNGAGGSSVSPVCGDGAVNGTEQCDGSALAGATCADALSDPLATGTLGCNSNCTFDTSSCSVSGDTCKDGVKNGAEQCDGADLGGATCASILGTSNAGGTLSCNAGNCTFDTSACIIWSTCAPGTYVSGEPSATTDRTCAGCPTGTFSDSQNAVSCEPWATCAPGTFVASAGSATANQVCAPCAEGTQSQSANQASCTLTTACQAGTVQTAPGDATKPPTCEACEAGTHCPGGAAAKQACAGGTWDHDSNAATACVAWTDCIAGQRVLSEGSATANRTCTACEAQSFSTAANVASCTGWKVCTPGNFVSDTGSATTDRKCAACDPGTLTTQPNQSVCISENACPAGTEQTAAGTATSPPECASCGAGSFCPGGSSPKEACADGTWDHDSNSATACITRTNCIAGQKVLDGGNATTNRTCAACESGTFSTQNNQDSCTTWQTCSAGSYVSAQGSAATDRACAPCAAGTQTTGANQSQCVALIGCQAGTVETTPATPSAPAVCAACEAGTYCPGGSAAKASCAPGTWDHDSSAATACVAWTDCIAGQKVLASGSATTNRTCTACEAESFSAATNATSCAGWATCVAGTFVSTPGSATQNRACSNCPASTYSSVANQPQCLPQTACAPGTEQTAAGDATKSPTCTLCAAGNHCPGGTTAKQACVNGTWDHDGLTSTACVAWQTCPLGTIVTASGTATLDRVCTECPDGMTSGTSNATTCVNKPQIVSGLFHSCVLFSDRTVKCWGDTGYGATGIKGVPSGTVATLNDLNSPGVVVKSLAAGGLFTCAALGDSTACAPWQSCERGLVKCWGFNKFGQLGNSTNLGSAFGNPTPTMAGSLADLGVVVTSLAAGTEHACVAWSDGSVECWGANKFGQLGNSTNIGTYNPNPTPTTVSDLTSPGVTVTTLAAGRAHTCALLSDGSVKCWGDNKFGQLGNSINVGTDTATPTPVTVSGLTSPGVTVISIAAGHGADSGGLSGDFTCAVLSDSSVKCWGANEDGQLGNSTNIDTYNPNPTPTTVSDLTSPGVTISGLSVGTRHSCALLSDGTFKCWGTNNAGQLGNSTNIGTSQPNPTPTTVSGLTDPVVTLAGISANGVRSCALLSDGSVKCWGSSAYTALGLGNLFGGPTPTTVTGL